MRGGSVAHDGYTGSRGIDRKKNSRTSSSYIRKRPPIKKHGPQQYRTGMLFTVGLFCKEDDR